MVRHWFGNLPSCGTVPQYRALLEHLRLEQQYVEILRAARKTIDDLEQQLRHRAWIDFSSVEIDQAKAKWYRELAADQEAKGKEEDEGKPF